MMDIEFSHVTFYYKSNLALRDITCEIAEGTTLLVAGHNGSGKSTFLKLMNGILKPTEGEITLGGESNVNKRTSELAAKCALSFQNPDDQLFAPTVKKELHFGIGNIHADDSLIGPIATLLKLGEVMERNPYSLTYAQRRLVAIASVAVMNTPILAFDEPTAGLSIREKAYLGDLIALLRKMKKTLVVVTHDLNFLLQYADSLLLLAHGKVEYFGGRDMFFDRKDSRQILARCGITYPVYPRISAATNLKAHYFIAADVADSLKKREPAPPSAQGQHQLEGA